MLAKHGVTSRKSFVDAKSALEKANARILGFAINGIDGMSHYYY
jgi:Mrp family chromosome partitioning ATPase